MRPILLLAGALFAAGLVVSSPARAEAPEYGGILTYMIPADAPPSLDGHREATYALVHAVAPFYSVLMRVDPEDPARNVLPSSAILPCPDVPCAA